MVPSKPIPKFTTTGGRGGGSLNHDDERLPHSSIMPRLDPRFELARTETTRCFDIAQTLSVGQLRKRHHSKLLDTRQRPHSVVRMVPLSDSVESLLWQKVHHLREQGFAEVHGWAPPVKAYTLPNSGIPHSNRGQPVSSITTCHDRSFRQSRSS